MSDSFGWYRPWLTSILARRPGEPGHVSSKARLVAAVLATKERDGVVRVTAAVLGTLTALDERTARRALDELKSHGYVDRHRARNYLIVTLRAARDGRASHPTTGEDRASHPTTGEDRATDPTMIGRDARLDRATDPPRSGVAPDSSTAARAAPSVGLPQAGDDLPSKPVGNRRRDLVDYQREVERWATRRYPNAKPQDAFQAVSVALGQGLATAHDVDGYITKWSPHITEGGATS